LNAWCDDLRGAHSGYGGFVEYFYPVLANKHIFDELLSPTQTKAVSEYMRGSILEEIDDQRGLAYSGMGARPYRWIAALTTHGVLARCGSTLEHMVVDRHGWSSCSGRAVYFVFDVWSERESRVCPMDP
jgi:hypothetical protein